jgi:PAS domain S-box-containing protein
MNSAQILGYPLLLIGVLELFLGFLLLKYNPRHSPVNRAVAFFSFFSAAFALSTAMMYVRSALGLDYNLFARASWAGWFTIPAALQTVFYLHDERSRKARVIGPILYAFWGGVLVLVFSTDLVVSRQYRLFPFENIHGPLEDPLRFIGGALIFWLIIEVLRLRNKISGIRRAQLNYYLSGTIIFGSGGAIIAGFLPLFGLGGLEPGLASYFSFPWVLLTFYAITRYRLFDIRIVVSRFLGILLLSIIVSSLHFILFNALEPAVGVVASIFISIPLIGFVIFSTPFSRAVQGWINDLVLGGRLAYQKLLKDSANAAISILHLDELLHFIVDSVRQGMKVERACLFLRDGQGRYMSRQCFRSIDDPRSNVELPRSVVGRMLQEPLVLVRDELESSSVRDDRMLAGDLEAEGAEVMVPLVSKAKLLGVLSLGNRINGDAYLQSDIEVLETLAGYAAVAIENAQLFEEAGRMRASLREQEGIFRTLAQTLPAAIFIHRGGKFLFANPAGVRMSGYSMQEILSMNFWDIAHPDYRQLIMSRSRARMGGEEPPAQYEFKIVRKDNSERWVLMTAGIIEYEGKAAVIGTVFDVTDRKHAEEDKNRLFEENARQYQTRLKEQERYRAVLAATTEGFWIHTADLRFEFVNDAYCRMTGFGREEIMSMSIADLEIVESEEQIKGHTSRIKERGYDRFETRHRRKDGSSIDLEVMVNYYARDNIFFSFLRDITERRKAEDERTRHQMEKENILKDLHDGIGGLTTNINLLAELARTSDDRSAVRHSLATIAELSRESLAEIRGFIQSLDAKELSWQAIAAEFRHLGSTIVEPHGVGFSVTTSFAENGATPSSTLTMNLFRIYKESLANIIKHAKATEVSVAFIVDGKKLVLDIRDNGRGLGERQGKGRGLANMRSRTEDLGGTFSLLSENGTHLVVEVPLP